MLLSDAVRDRIRFYQQKKNMSLWALFKASGVPMSTLAAFMSKRTELIKLDTLLHICEGFGITLTEFFEDGVFKENTNPREIIISINLYCFSCFSNVYTMTHIMNIDFFNPEEMEFRLDTVTEMILNYIIK